MKKILYSVMAVAAAVLMSSCAKEVNMFGTTDDVVAVNFSLGLQDGAQTRAVADGTSVNQLIYSLFREVDGVYELQTNFATGGQLSRMVEGGFPTTETVNLAKGQNYKLVFWAQVANTGFYSLSPATDLKINYEGLNNVETRDAFYKVVDITADQLEGTVALDVLLTRPFAQINVGVTEADWNNAYASGITVNQSRIHVGEVASELNLLNNVPSAPVTLTYELADIPATQYGEDLEIDLDGDKVKEAKFKWVSMCYVLPMEPESSDNLDKLAFRFTTNGGDIVIRKGMNNVPIQRNWRTNIFGQLLTGTIDLNIAIDPAFEDDHNYRYTYPSTWEKVE